MSPTETKADSARRKRRRSVDANRLWWGGFVLGTALICASAWVPVPYFYVVGLVLPLLMLMAYAYLGWKYIGKTEDQAQFADSVYYLGFLFTLITLAMALIFLATSTDWETVPLAELIGRFGLALGTTIVGLAIRVAWVNTLKSLHDVRTDSEQALLFAADEFRSQLQASSEAFKTLNSTYMSELEKAAALSSKTYQDHAFASDKALSDVLDRVSDAIEVSTNAYTATFEKKMATLALPDEWIRRAVTAPINAISESLSSVSGELDSILESQRQVSVDSGRLAKNYVDIADSLEPLADVSKKVGDIAGKFERVSGSLAAFVQTLDSKVADVDERLVGLTESIGRLEESVSSLSTAMASAGQSSESLAEIAKVANSHKNELETHLAASRQAVNTLHSELLGAAQLVTRKLGDG